MAEQSSNWWKWAYARMSQSYRATHDLAAFQSEVDAMPALRTHTDDTVSGRSVRNSTAEMTISLTTATGSEMILIDLVSEGGGWKITSFRSF